MIRVVQLVNISEIELEEINQLFYTLENIVNEQRQWDIESVVRSSNEAMQGIISAFISLIINNFENSLARFRIYSRYIKKMKDGKIRVHTTTRTSPTEHEDITWILCYPENEFQKLVICGMNTSTVPIYDEPQYNRIEIPRMDQKWISFMKAKQNVEIINHFYMALKDAIGVKKTRQLFIIHPNFKEELDELFGFLEGIFKVVAYISIMGANVYGWKGIILKKKEGYDIIFDNYRELESLDVLLEHDKMTNEEYIDLLNYQWKKQLEGLDTEVKISVEKEKRRIIYTVREKKKRKVKKKK